MTTPKHKFELIVDGFDGSTDATDHHVIWVGTDMSREALASALPKHVSIDSGALPRHYPMDYELPQDMDALAARVQETYEAFMATMTPCEA